MLRLFKNFEYDNDDFGYWYTTYSYVPSSGELQEIIKSCHNKSIKKYKKNHGSK